MFADETTEGKGKKKSKKMTKMHTEAVKNSDNPYDDGASVSASAKPERKRRGSMRSQMSAS